MERVSDWGVIRGTRLDGTGDGASIGQEPEPCAAEKGRCHGEADEEIKRGLSM